MQPYARAYANHLCIIVHYSTIRSAKCRRACVCHKFIVPLHRNTFFVIFFVRLIWNTCAGMRGCFLSFCWSQQNDHIVGVSKMVQWLFVSFLLLPHYNAKRHANLARVRSLKTRCVGRPVRHRQFA